MKDTSLTIRMDPTLAKLLAGASRRLGRSRSDLAREALRRQLRLLQFEALRAAILPRAGARGFLVDEDVFDAVS